MANFVTLKMVDDGRSDTSLLNTWTVVTGTTQAMAVNGTYLANGASLITFTLPASAPVGAFVKIVGKGAGKYKIAQNAGDVIRLGATNTSGGTGGSITAGTQFDVVELVCTQADDEWVIVNHEGTFTFV